MILAPPVKISGRVAFIDSSMRFGMGDDGAIGRRDRRKCQAIGGRAGGHQEGPHLLLEDLRQLLLGRASNNRHSHRRAMCPCWRLDGGEDLGMDRHRHCRTQNSWLESPCGEGVMPTEAPRPCQPLPAEAAPISRNFVSKFSPGVNLYLRPSPLSGINKKDSILSFCSATSSGNGPDDPDECQDGSEHDGRKAAGCLPVSRLTRPKRKRIEAPGRP